MSEEQPKQDHRSRPDSENFRAFIAADWAERDLSGVRPLEAAQYAAPRRTALAEKFPEQTLVVPAGGLKVRSNDTDYVFRPHSAFAHLTGLGADREPDAVLVIRTGEAGSEPEAVFYFRPMAARDSEEFFADSRYGEFWVGPRPVEEDIRRELGLDARHVDRLEADLAADADRLRVVPDADRDVTELVRRVRGDAADDASATERDDELAHACSVLRLVKDDWEADQMREAVRATGRAFDAVIENLDEAVRRGRGERWVEGVFGLHARHAGNGVGYDSIVASGDHANTLHWIRNTGDLDPNELLLLDAGVELDSLFTADVTRTLPIGGTFTDAQRKVYDAVYAAQEAGIAAVKPGNKFGDVHAAAIRVIAEHLHEWGLLPEGVSVEDTLAPEGQYHRRWMVHGTSHHLGIDVHDCALARREEYMGAELVPGMCLTVEPGLYFKADDLKVPEEFRGIGVRIEDDVLVTGDGCENLSGFMPRTSADVEAWMKRLRG
ncbi:MULTISPECIES: aminopeptidase P family protein [Kytococcus]|uniref:Xaa-Pro aminopeptidase n=1 Tax=Kytococcus schroeteri TaxID=138300 RepID=A0A2I1PDE8_9MICO|nr:MULTISPECIES: aminopeptidase P family protein [Kytococcus]OFS08387.1 Xaa-Pro aminopeptidase [Kytococcus sp. HMSC28H12]PKZ42611.1 aminopeptidase P family protein [Kytococcus schroeteri]